MSKHTPEPWEQQGRVIVHFGKRGAMICELSEPRASNVAKHATLRLGSPDAEEAYANGRLIAAAPELLAVCKEAEEIIEDRMDNASDPGAFDRWDNLCAAVAVRLRTAIAKAKEKS